MIFTRNNLDQSPSLYLQQHHDNPVWWQEWHKDVLESAQAQGKIIFCSIGYSTCHWCHVMAQEAFSDKDVADYLNAHFVCIKVDRELRPDIDQYAMAFIAALGAQGGWPLNIFFTPTVRPIYALTYAPLTPRYNMPAFMEILTQIKRAYDDQKDQIEPFHYTRGQSTGVDRDHLIKPLARAFDRECAGFGNGMKFPPHCTMLFMLYDYEVDKDSLLKDMITKTLDQMLLSGLHDHLQGGFYRYCVDREWVIPHFEKMLYDQAMLLWQYALGFQVFKNETYKTTVHKIVQCLDETFERDGLYVSGHDADTHHEEGATYVWTDKELTAILTPEELTRFKSVYAISENGNFEGSNHLVKIKSIDIQDIETKLLQIRRQRPQPGVDEKIITSWNCLLGIAFIQAYRSLENEALLKKAELIYSKLMEHNYRNDHIYHSSINGEPQREGFLQDSAAMLLFLTYLQEETGAYGQAMDQFYAKVKECRTQDGWIESSHEDFLKVPAESFDHPTPSSVSMAETAMLRADVLHGREYTQGQYSDPLASDFFNIAVLMRNSLFHVIEAPTKIPFSRLPVNTIQVKGKEFQDCYKLACTPIDPLNIKLR